MYDTLTMPHDASQLHMIITIFCVGFRSVQKSLAPFTISDDRDNNCASSSDLYTNAKDLGTIIWQAKGAMMQS